MTDDLTEHPCRRRTCKGDYESAGSGVGDDGRPIMLFECDRCGDVQTRSKAEPPTIPLFTEIQ